MGRIIDSDDTYPDGLPEDLYVDIESTIHQHCGHDDHYDEANDWVTDLMSALTPLIVRALDGGRSAAPTRDEVTAVAGDLIEGSNLPTFVSGVAAMHDAVQALLSRSAAGEIDALRSMVES